jgi:hypothetical protein
MAQMDFPKCPVYLFYGSHADAILKARDSVLNATLDPATRNENLTEYYPTAISDTLKLADCFGEIAGDLATMSFMPDAAKVVVVTNPVELFGESRRAAAKKKPGKTSAGAKSGGQPLDGICDWIERVLPETGHVLMLLAFEDESSAREVDTKGALILSVQKVGYAKGYADSQKAFFRIEEAIAQKNLDPALNAVRDLWKPGKGDMSVYNSVQRCLRYLLQANIARERKALRDPTAQALYFPADPKANLFKAHEAVRKKYLNAPIYRTPDLLEAYRQLLDVYRAMRPRPDDLYVPDAQGLLEQMLVRLLTSPAPRRP